MREIWLIVLAVMVGCARTMVLERPAEPFVVYFEDDDEEMDAAIREARKSVDGYIAQLPALRQQGAYFAVKVPIAAGERTEHVWIESPEFRAGSFHGTIANTPVEATSELGDVSTPASRISDWMVVRDGELFGGYTVIVARSRLSAEQREHFDRSMWFRVPSSARSFWRAVEAR